MDDKTFDLKTANDWIKVIENKNDPREKDLYPLVNQWLSKTNTESLIDVGCGQGKLSKNIENHIKYYGIDPSPYLLKRAKSLYSSRAFSLGNAYKIPNNDVKYDSYISISVWHLLEDIDTATAELARVLKKNGSFFIMLTLKEDFNLWTHHYNEYSFQDDCFTGTTQDGSLDTIYFRSLDRLNTTFKQHNLKIEDIQKLRIWSIISGIKG